MSHEAGGRDPTNNTGPFQSSHNSNSGSISPAMGDQASVESNDPTTVYGIGPSNDSRGASCSPNRGSSHDSHYRSGPPIEPVENSEKQRPAEQPPLLEPPVTKTTLSELDVNKIVHNPKLRHDINFDPDLHFRPNLDGEKGRKKTQKMDNFYETMRKQLRNYLVDRVMFEREIGDAEWCLPATLKAIRGILETLVPQRDRSTVEETFNVDLLMQQFRKGVADLPKLASWLSQLLKCHCAPMRDAWVDGMVNEISKGDREGDVALLVLGMRNLLGVLEAMKLDVANHQIRCLRPLLIEDTILFEQKFFIKKIAMGRIDVAGAHSWFKMASSLPEIGPLDSSQGNFWDFTKGLVNLTLASKADEMVPHTFLFDEERLVKLRSDMEDLINLEICMHMYRGLRATSRSQEARFIPNDDTPTFSAAPSPRSRPASPDDELMQSTIAQLPMPHHFAPKSKPASLERGYFRRDPSGQQKWIPAVEHDISTPISPSPQSSPSSTASTPPTCPPTPLYLSLPQIDSTSRLRTSLLAILASSNTADKWSLLSQSLALEILRATATPLTALPQFEHHLAFHLSKPTSRIYQDAEHHILLQIFPTLHKLVETYTPLTSLQVFEAATTPKVTPNAISGVKDEIEEISTRIAHIGILHWRVWAPLAYLVDPDEPLEDSQIDQAKNLPS